MGLRSCMRALSSCCERALLSSCGVGLLTAVASRLQGSGVAGHRLSCPSACETFPEQRWNPRPLHWQADSSPPDHQGSPQSPSLHPEDSALKPPSSPPGAGPSETTPPHVRAGVGPGGHGTGLPAFPPALHREASAPQRGREP